MVLGEGRHSCDCPDSRYCGAVYAFDRDIYGQIQSATSDGFDFIVTPLSADVRGEEPRPDVDLSASIWTTQVVGQLQRTVDEDIDVMHTELATASYLGVQAVIATPPRRKRTVVKFARALNLAISRVGGAGGCCPQVWLSFPLEAESGLIDDDDIAANQDRDEEIKAWDAWNIIRRMCDESPRIGVVLEIASGSSYSSCTSSLSASAARWMGEPLKAILMHAACFIPNKAGFPVLPKRLQDFVTEMYVRNVRVIFAGPVTDTIEASEDNGTKTYDIDTDMNVDDLSKMKCSRYFWEYLSYLFRRMEPLSELEQMECGYRDVLQYPLQPLMDNLEASTYEVFERDAVKYELYKDAVRARLLDMDSCCGSSGGSGIVDDNGDEVVIVMVVGAGRGPIVSASLRAADSVGKGVRVYALEKNPNAIVTLRVKQSSDPLWSNRVTIVQGDMRDQSVGSGGANALPQADIVVSELLGSFGDNELSPECLDGAQRFVRGFDDNTPGVRRGVMIPQRYTSYLAPITCSKLWNDVRSGGGSNGGGGNANSMQPFESPYVVKLHSHSVLAAPQPVFTFSHPVWPEEQDCTSCGTEAERNSRDAEVRFPIAIDTNSVTKPPQRTRHIPPPGGRGADATRTSTPEAGADGRHHPRACCHGFAGYFECTLYGDVKMSTLPESHSENMYSWFPIYFPVRDPVDLPRGASVLEARFWRSASTAMKKVWYEWCITSPTVSPVHNPGGRSYAMCL